MKKLFKKLIESIFYHKGACYIQFVADSTIIKEPEESPCYCLQLPKTYTGMVRLNDIDDGHIILSDDSYHDRLCFQIPKIKKVVVTYSCAKEGCHRYKLYWIRIYKRVLLLIFIIMATYIFFQLISLKKLFEAFS